VAVKCPKCHSENSETKQFCGDCGIPLPSSKKIRPEVTKTLNMPIKELTTGATFAGRYQIVEELGHGGMGRVYKVHDTKLGEKIALKLIRPEALLDRKTVERFSNELKLARKIRHKNICQMFDLGEDQGTHYITMEYIHGEDLKQLIRKVGRLSPGQAIGIARQVCAGLEEAHKLGVIHRDLKPQNIMIDEDGNARIMDFGIARSLSGKGITGAGVMIGTPEYMSPEQVEGKETDPRSDIYSLGVILYEMATGRVPFEGDTPFTIGVKHKSEPPEDPLELNPQLPPDLSRLILRCLDKDKAARFQTAAEVGTELEKIEKGMPTTARIVPARKTLTSRKITVKFTLRKLIVPVSIITALAAVALLFLFLKHGQVYDSIAVLPLENPSQDSQLDSFSDGLALELIARLYQFSSLRVAPFRQVKDYKNTKKSLQEIGQELNIKVVLDAAVQRVGKQIKITSQLIDTSTGRAIWAPPPFKRDEAEIEALVGDVIEAIILEIRVKLTPQEKTRLSPPKTALTKVDTQAYDLYLRAKKILWDLDFDSSSERWQTAYKYIEQAIGIDPDFAANYWLLSGHYVKGFVWSFLSYKEAIGKAEAAMDKALSLDPDSAEAHKAAYNLNVCKWDWEGARQELQRAVELAPGDPELHSASIYVSLIHGQFEEALAAYKQLIQVDPSSDPDKKTLAGIYGNTRHYNEAIALLTESIKNNPNNSRPHWSLAWIYAAIGRHAEALDEADKYLNLRRDADKTSSNLGIALVYAQAGRRNDALKLLDEYLMSIKGKPVDSFGVAEVYSVLGEKESAFEWLDRAVHDHASYTAWLKVDQPLDNIRSDPRFKEYLKKVGFEK
jgi:serine/threonine protein kinase/Flp pilus assembly protein TadD